MITIPDSDRHWAEQVWDKIKIKIASQRDRMGTMVPYIPVDGRYRDKMADDIYWWCNGFWPGILWLLYHDTGEIPYLETARTVEERLDGALAGFIGLHHDVGFMWTLTARLDFQLTENDLSRTRALHAATILAGRYNPRGRFIRSWNRDFPGWIIIDCMMNLPLLYWASDQLKDPSFRYIAIEHTETALKYLVREDGSCNHIAVLDVENGNVLDTPGGQGYASGSSWSRGQSWALYGFALAMRHSGEARYGETSKKIARYVLGELSRRDFVPPVDYRQPAEPHYIDTSAGMICAAGLLCLTDQTHDAEGQFYYDSAVKILKKLEAEWCDWDPAVDSIVQRGSARYHEHKENDVPLIYADYYFIEAVHRLLYPEFRVW